jgi:hypothetical protein
MNSQASKAMENGFTAQFTKSVMPMPLQCDLTWPSAPKSILTSIGTIITQMSRPTGMLTRANSTAPIAWNAAGKSCPRAIPATMHSATHTVR